MTTASRRRPLADPGRWVAGSLLSVLAIVCLVPIIWLVFAPSKSAAELANQYPLSFGSFSGYATAWANLTSVADGILYLWILNTALYSVAIIAIATSTALMAGYALATSRMPGGRALLTLTLVMLVVPGAALVLPLYLEMSAVGLTNTVWSVVLPSSLFPFGVYLSFIHFSTSIPRSIYEAARIDGASEWRIFARIALPLSKSLVGLLVFFSFVGAWGNYFLPFIMLTEGRLFTLQLGLQSLMSNLAVINGASVTDIPIHAPEAALAALVTVVPVAIVFLICQRYLVRGFLGGAVKD